MADQNVNNQSVTWNSGGTTFDAVKFNVTDTASAVASLLQNFQVGGVVKFSVRKDGKGYFAGDLDVTGNILNALNVFAGVKVTVFTASGTYTADTKMLYMEGWAWGGGGGGGGAPATSASTVGACPGGNGGAKAYLFATKATIGASQTVTIGAGGAGGTGAAGNAGSATTLGSLLSAKGGEGGAFSAAAIAVGPSVANPSQSATGTIRGWTYPATPADFSTAAGFAVHSTSGHNELGGATVGAVNLNGDNAPANTGAGGGGTVNIPSQAARTGGTGGSGFMFIKEYLRP